MTQSEKEADMGISPSNASQQSTDATPGEAATEKNTAGWDDVDVVYDHGWKAWSQVLAAFFGFFNSWGIVTSFGVFQTYYEQEILSNESPSTISWIGSIQSFLLLFVSAVTGPLFDAGYSRQILFVSWFLIPFGMMMASIASEFWQILLAQAFCVGLGSGCVFVPSVAVLPQYFKKKRAFANGIAATGSSIGGIIYPIMFRQLQLKIGFPWAARVVGFVAFGTLFITVTFLRVRFQPKEKRALFQLSAFRDPIYTLFCLGQLIGFCGLYNMMVYIQPYAINNNIMREHLAFYLLAILNAASSFGRVLPNYFADYVGPFNVLTPMAFASGVLGLAWLGISSTAGVIVLAALYGFTSGGFVSVPPVVLMSITPDMRDFGTRLGMAFVCSACGALIGTPIGGAILNATGNDYFGVKLLTGLCLVCSSVLMSVARYLKGGPHLLVRA